LLPSHIAHKFDRLRQGIMRDTVVIPTVASQAPQCFMRSRDILFGVCGCFVLQTVN